MKSSIAILLLMFFTKANTQTSFYLNSNGLCIYIEAIVKNDSIDNFKIIVKNFSDEVILIPKCNNGTLATSQFPFWPDRIHLRIGEMYDQPDPMDFNKGKRMEFIELKKGDSITAIQLIVYWRSGEIRAFSLANYLTFKKRINLYYVSKQSELDALMSIESFIKKRKEIDFETY